MLFHFQHIHYFQKAEEQQDRYAREDKENRHDLPVERIDRKNLPEYRKPQNRAAGTYREKRRADGVEGNADFKQQHQSRKARQQNGNGRALQMIEAEHICGNHNKNDIEYDRERRGDRLGQDIDKKVALDTVAVRLKRQNERRQADGKRA